MFSQKIKIKLITILMYVSILLHPATSLARPVSYPGGWTFMQMNDADANSMHIHYSPTAKYSIGYRGSYWREKEFHTHSLQINNLLKRKNNTDSQANAYLKSGVGFAYDPTTDATEPHVFTGLALDWENRRFFTAYENSFHYSGEIDEEFAQSIHLGVAPYIGEYGDLHTWLMVEVEQTPGAEDEIKVTPHLRFFKNVYLIEIGVSEDKEVMANFVVRF